MNSRYYCPEHPHVRVMPYDSYEGLTESTFLRKRPQRGGLTTVLLHTVNSKPSAYIEDWEDGHKLAYCWVCEEFVMAERRTQNEIIAMYLHRVNVSIRRVNPDEASLRMRPLLAGLKLPRKARRRAG
jgi:hypothetical protein